MHSLLSNSAFPTPAFITDWIPAMRLIRSFTLRFGFSFLTTLISVAGLTPAGYANEPPAGFTALLADDSLDGWSHKGNWSINSGVVAREGSGGPLTYQDGPLPDDFELRFEWKVAKGSNSGIYYRPGQYEYQILDNTTHRDGANPRTSAASLYFCMQPSRDVTRAAGQWNTGRIVCKDTVIQHWCNGVKVIDFDYEDPRWQFHVDLLRKRGGNLSDRDGKLWLQDHGDPVWFRNIYLRAIPDEESLQRSEVTPASISDDVLKKEAEKLDGIMKRRQKAGEAADEKQSATRRPNIIYVMADDLGYGDLGCYGQSKIRTPNLDQMAAEGIRFTDHYAGHTVCRPSRLVLWTGQHVGHTRLIGNASRDLNGSEITVAKLLQDAGYATGGVGKWALGNVDTPDEIDNAGHPNNNGFDYWFGYMNQSNAHNYYPAFLWENDRIVTLKGNVIDDIPNGRGRVAKDKMTYSHDVMVEKAFEFIRRNASAPFLLHMHLTIPHANNEAGRVHGDGMEVPDYGVYANESWPNPEKGFAAMIGRLDSDMGRLFDLLDEKDIAKDTLVIFTSDNGPHHEGGHDEEFFDSNGVLQGAKRSMHEGGIRVPFIARWPGKIVAGSTSDWPSAFWDFLPTACDLAGVDPPASIDGVSYLPALLGQTPAGGDRYLYWASSEGDTSVGIRRGRWKLVNYPPTQKRRPKTGIAAIAENGWRLYDLANDPAEKNDMAGQHPERVRRMLEEVRGDGLWDEPQPAHGLTN
ncbi:Arylsulfatase [Crateriforma conspicua]|nr:Arylsulfatase [Crateriforma conspicua]